MWLGADGTSFPGRNVYQIDLLGIRSVHAQITEEVLYMTETYYAQSMSVPFAGDGWDVYLTTFFCEKDTDRIDSLGQSTRWEYDPVIKSHLPRTIKLRALCSANLVT